MYSGSALRELTVCGRARQDTGNFDSVLKDNLGVRTRVPGGEVPSKTLSLIVWAGDSV